VVCHKAIKSWAIILANWYSSTMTSSPTRVLQSKRTR
jgi:hypothetical protein